MFSLIPSVHLTWQMKKWLKLLYKKNILSVLLEYFLISLFIFDRCKKWEVPLEKVYNKTQREKFRWAIDMADEDYEF